MGLITRIADKAGALGSVVSAMGCAACFPAIASLGAAIGLGFLQEYEGLFISSCCRCSQSWLCWRMHWAG
jgi:mercuric ion transport protein